ncbi:MAG: hypothetical protein KBC98_02525 [Candidatus Pacebacteria bacterium]|nr:hypothetical protein [Candidatus Paceibacterota bacterium]
MTFPNNEPSNIEKEISREDIKKSLESTLSSLHLLRDTYSYYLKDLSKETDDGLTYIRKTFPQVKDGSVDQFIINSISDSDFLLVALEDSNNRGYLIIKNNGSSFSVSGEFGNLFEKQGGSNIEQTLSTIKDAFENE